MNGSTRMELDTVDGNLYITYYSNIISVKNKRGKNEYCSLQTNIQSLFGQMVGITDTLFAVIHDENTIEIMGEEPPNYDWSAKARRSVTISKIPILSRILKFRLVSMKYPELIDLDSNTIDINLPRQIRQELRLIPVYDERNKRCSINSRLFLIVETEDDGRQNQLTPEETNVTPQYQPHKFKRTGFYKENEGKYW